ncbi:MAG: class I SAM-dependent methyltransferase [Planctomycetes bacterium]|nr:class I SAM-dependent methyltransferase [Planctomycetota bacterium]MCB9911087.1 class I SAM-dependent methyltransferase [Planctomycetota bacterium]HPF13010.1 class I SAM-dependent methyltransferase [Planctomycetota bacterium]HRV80032.1 class I SAM-dependent methyltransferase [Planctomycetota bacterium]
MSSPASPQSVARCRFCSAPLEHTFVNLGKSPLCESFLTLEQLDRGEMFYPLHAWVCSECYLVQLKDYVAADSIFDDYAYFSSFSDSWLRHAAHYCEAMTERFNLGKSSFCVEVASNDGYLLQNFVQREIPCLGVEPSWTVAQAAREKGVPTMESFFGRATAKAIRKEHSRANLITANNVVAHVPDINDFVGGFEELLAPKGVLTLEFPHLARLMEHVQYDTIYHEHFSYLSFGTIVRILNAQGLSVFDVEELPSHGGSLRVFAHLTDPGYHKVSERVGKLLETERSQGFEALETYLDFTAKVEASKRSTLQFLIEAKQAGKKVVAYGAPGKGNTLLNYCGIRSDMIDFAVDRNPYKHGRYTPGTQIPILPPDALDQARPDYIFILPWNLEKEIRKQLDHARAWGARFVIPIPTIQILD